MRLFPQACLQQVYLLLLRLLLRLLLQQVSDRRRPMRVACLVLLHQHRRTLQLGVVGAAGRVKLRDGRALKAKHLALRLE